MNRYISLNEVFYDYSENATVLASDKALFFPKSFCIIPFEQISSTKLVDIIVEKDIVFKLINGKKNYTDRKQKQYAAVMTAIQNMHK